MSGFGLTKWYVDYVTDSGDVYIGYLARVASGPLSFWLRGNLTWSGEHASSSTRLSLRDSAPEIRSGQLIWKDRQLRRQVEFQQKSPAIHRNLFSSESGEVVWDCHMPSADVKISAVIGAGRMALGYVESLSMTLTPSQIGLRKLWWGRFVSSSDSLVWIKWEGDQPLDIVFLNGDDQPRATIEQDRIRCGDDVRLDWAEPSQLRTGTIGAGALSKSPLVRFLIPKKLTDIHETKMLARGTLYVPGKLSSTGWVIYEQVSFAD